MESVLPLKMLGVFALVLLVSSMNEGKILSKCDVKAQLEAAEFQVVPANTTVEDLIARLVCRASRSGFNTHLVKFITKKHEDHASKQDAPQASFPFPSLAPPPPQGTQGSLQNQPQAPPPGQRPVQSQNQPQAPPQGQRPVQTQGMPQAPPQGQRPVQAQGMPQAPPQGQRPVQTQGMPQAPPQGQRPVQAQGMPQAPPQGQRPVQAQGMPQAPPQGQRPVQAQGMPQAPPQGQRPVQAQGMPQAPPQSPPKGPIGKSKRFAPQEKDRKPTTVWHQYGLFQLNDKLACDSEVVPTLNLCQMNCSALIDEDIRDDITCVKTLISTMIAGTRGQLSDSPPLPQKLDTLLEEECQHVVASQYFDECAKKPSAS